MLYHALPLKYFSFIILKTAIYSALVNALLFLLLERLGVIHTSIYINDDPNMAITLVPVIVSSVLPTLLGGVIFWLLLRYLKKGITIFGVASVVLGLISFAAPFQLPEIPLGMAMALNLMHVVVLYNMLHYFRKAAHKTVLLSPSE